MSQRTVIAAIGVAAVAAGGAVGGVFAVTGQTGAHSNVSLSANSRHVHHPREMDMARGWSFSKLNSSNDPTFNQLLGINNRGQIAGYFGSGAAGHPNKGYTLSVGGFSSFTNENFPGAIQTQVIGVNDTGVSVGFYSTQNTESRCNNNFGFYDWHGQFHSVNFPTRNMASPTVNRLLGVNNSDIAVGFYMEPRARPTPTPTASAAAGSTGSTSAARSARPPPASTTGGWITGFYTGHGGVTHGCLSPLGRVIRAERPGRLLHHGLRRQRLG